MPPARLAPSAHAPKQWVNLDNLDSLAFNFPGQDGSKETGWAIYAEPIDPKNPLGAVKQVGAPTEGFSCIDDVARVALIYLDRFEKDPSNKAFADKATQAVNFCLNLEDGKGTYYNFVEEDGKINKDGITSKPGMNWWTARAFYALAKADRVLKDSADPALLKRIEAAQGRTLDRLEAEHRAANVPPELEAAYKQTGVKPGGLVDHSGTITSIFALGLIEKLKAGNSPRERELLESYGDSMVKLTRPKDEPLLGGLHLNSLWDTKTVHLYGNRQVQALADGGVLLNKPEWIASAREEADTAYPRMLTSWLVPFAFSPSPEPNPQIAYAAEAVVTNLQSVYKATGETKFSMLAGLYGTWFNGANAAGLPVYHPETGRSFDGVDPHGVSTNSGAESNIETQFAMNALEGSPGEKLLGLAHTATGSTDKILEGDDFKPTSGQPQRENRTLNGGAVRQIWSLKDADKLSVNVPEGGGLLTWKSTGGSSLQIGDQAVVPQDGTWQITQLPNGGKVELGGNVQIDSLVHRPSESERTWTDGTKTVALQVQANDDSWKILGA